MTDTSKAVAIKIGDIAKCYSWTFQVTRLFTNEAGLKVCYFDGESPNECFVPENLCEFVYRPASMNRTDPRDELIRRMVGLVRALRDETPARHEVRRLCNEALTSAEHLWYGGGEWVSGSQ